MGDQADSVSFATDSEKQARWLTGAPDLLFRA
jgi:hypothetical protein